MTKEQVLLMVAGALIVLGMFVIVTALRRARQREHARDRVDALLDLCAEPAAPEPVAIAVSDDAWERPFREQPVMAPVRAATGHRFVVSLSDTSGSFGVRPGFNRGQTGVRPQ
jgi:predicted DNA-binding transcriptional regulator YafY